MWHVWGEGRFAFSVSKGNLRERGNLEDTDLKIRDNNEMNFPELGRRLRLE